MKSFIRKYLTHDRLYPVLMIFMANLIVYYGSRVTNAVLARPYLDLSSGLDFATPIIPQFVYIYIAAFPFWYISYYVLSNKNKELARNLVLTNVAAKLFCGIMFVLVPCTNVRQEITGSGLSSWLLNLIYVLDTPDNLFPSIHCMESWMCFSFLNDQKDVKWSVKAASFIMAFAVCLSTVFTGQHVWIDVISGIVVAESFKVFVPYFAEAASAHQLSFAVKNTRSSD